MATTGQIYTAYYTSTSNSSSKWRVAFNWSSTQDAIKNTSTISWNLKVDSTVSSSYKISVKGLQVFFDDNLIYERPDVSGYDLVGHGTVLASGSKEINHKEDGTIDAINVKVIADIYYGYMWSTGTGTISLNTIPRATALDSVTCSTTDFSGKLTLKYTPRSTSYYNNYKIYLSSNKNTILFTETSSFKPTSTNAATKVIDLSSKLSTICSSLPNIDKDYLCIDWYTYSSSGGSQIGSISSQSILLSIPTTITPSASLGYKINNPTNAATTKILQNCSSLDLTINSPTPSTGSSLTSYKIEAIYGGKIIEYKEIPHSSSNTISFGPFGQTGSWTFKLTVTDSRGRQGTASTSLECILYSSPVILSFSPSRSNNGTILTGTFTVEYKSSVVSGVTNSITAYLYYKVKGSSTYSQKSITSNANWVTGLSSDKVYQVYCVIQDKYSKSSPTSVITVYGDSKILNIPKGKNGIAFGKKADANGGNFECVWPAVFDNKVTCSSLSVTGGTITNSKIDGGSW